MSNAQLWYVIIAASILAFVLIMEKYDGGK